MAHGGEEGWVEIQPPVSRPNSIRTRLSTVAWESGLETFFVHGVPFAYSTGSSFAARVTRILTSHLDGLSPELLPSTTFHLYEMGAGLGVLACHILDSLRDKHPGLYSRICFHVTDASESILRRVEELGVLRNHLDRVRFEVLDVLDPHFKSSEEPHFVTQCFTLSALPARHIEISQGEVSELLVRTYLPRSAPVVDNSRFPPEIVDAREVVEKALSDDPGRWNLLVGQVAPMLREELMRVPIDESDMPPEERHDLEGLIGSPNPGISLRFNFCGPYVRALRDILSRLFPGGGILIHDFGWTDRHVVPDGQSLSTSYGATTCHGVWFPVLVDTVSVRRATCRYTSNGGGEPQVLLVEACSDTSAGTNTGTDPGAGADTNSGAGTANSTEPGTTAGSDNARDHLTELFHETFRDTGCEAVRRAIQRCTEPDPGEVQYPAMADSTIFSLEQDDRSDYGLLVAVSWELLRRDYPVEAAEIAERTLHCYGPVAVDSHVLLGMAYRRMGRLDASQRHLERALSICEGYPLAQAELAHLYLQQRKQREHLDAVIGSLRCPPSDYMWEQVVTAIIGLAVHGRDNEARAAIDSVSNTAARHPALVPEFVSAKLQSIGDRYTTLGGQAGEAG